MAYPSANECPPPAWSNQPISVCCSAGLDDATLDHAIQEQCVRAPLQPLRPRGYGTLPAGIHAYSPATNPDITALRTRTSVHHMTLLPDGTVPRKNGRATRPKMLERTGRPPPSQTFGWLDCRWYILPKCVKAMTIRSHPQVHRHQVSAPSSALIEHCICITPRPLLNPWAPPICRRRSPLTVVFKNTRLQARTARPILRREGQVVAAPISTG